ncbi:hypothetical protein [Aquibacillus saliphilus]|uniref:hypothetical protein n=1 Tax=Aquibacillus saliphilus TaxID=1909422 RepID=UPI001CF05CB8|nr:hypothetical protein [Aquibacillus saliphilus]
MKNNSRGYFLIEALASLSIVLTITFTFIPILNQIKLEEHILSQRRSIQSTLHDELQLYIWKTFKLPVNHEMKVNKRQVTFTFTKEDNLVKGCAEWNNEKDILENFCLYGFPQE